MRKKGFVYRGMLLKNWNDIYKILTGGVDINGYYVSVGPPICASSCPRDAVGYAFRPGAVMRNSWGYFRSFDPNKALVVVLELDCHHFLEEKGPCLGIENEGNLVHVTSPKSLPSSLIKGVWVYAREQNVFKYLNMGMFISGRNLTNSLLPLSQKDGGSPMVNIEPAHRDGGSKNITVIFGDHYGVEEDFEKISKEMDKKFEESKLNNRKLLVFYEFTFDTTEIRISKMPEKFHWAIEDIKNALNDNNLLEKLRTDFTRQVYDEVNIFAETINLISLTKDKYTKEHLLQVIRKRVWGGWSLARLKYLIEKTDEYDLKLYFEQPGINTFKDLLELINFVISNGEKDSLGYISVYGEDYEYFMKKRIKITFEDREEDFAELVFKKLKENPNADAIVVFGLAHMFEPDLINKLEKRELKVNSIITGNEEFIESVKKERDRLRIYPEGNVSFATAAHPDGGAGATVHHLLEFIFGMSVMGYE